MISPDLAAEKLLELLLPPTTTGSDWFGILGITAVPFYRSFVSGDTWVLRFLFMVVAVGEKFLVYYRSFAGGAAATGSFTTTAYRTVFFLR